MVNRIFLLKIIYILVITISGQKSYANEYDSLIITDQNKSNYEIQTYLEHEDLTEAIVDISFINFNKNIFDEIVNRNLSEKHRNNNKRDFDTIHLSLPDEKDNVVLTVLAVKEYTEKTFTLEGNAKDDDFSFFSLTGFNEYLVGKISYKGFTYLIKTSNKENTNDLIVLKIEPLKIIRDVSSKKTKIVDLAENIVGTKSSKSTGGNVRILFLSARDVYQPEATLVTMLSEFNQTLSQSGVIGKSVSFAGIRKMDTTFPNLCKGTLLGRMHAENYEFLDIELWRTNANADIVFLMINGGTCNSSGSNSTYGRVGGQARGPTQYNTNGNNANAVSVDSYLLADNTGIHEVGHVFGGFHPLDPNAVNPRLGMINPANNWQSIMGGYDPGCDFTGPNSTCVRINRFTNPNQTYLGGPLGSGTQNMSSWLLTAMNTVSNYKNFIPQIPSAPTNLVSNPIGHCGITTLTWSGNDSKTLEYQVFYDNNSGFSSPVMTVRGIGDINTATKQKVTSSDNTGYFRVKACNAGGCSLYSNQVTSYWSPCT